MQVRVRPRAAGSAPGGFTALNAPSTTWPVNFRPAPAGVTLPRTFIDTRIDSAFLSGGGATVVTVTGTGTGSNLQSLLNTAATTNDKRVIKIPAGVTLEGNFILPQKTHANWTYVMSSDVYDGTFGVVEGVRVNPNNTHLAYLESSNSSAVFNTASATGGCDKYRFIGLHIRPKSTNSFMYWLMALTENMSDESHFCFDHTLDRCVVSGNGVFGHNLQHGVILNGGRQAAVDCYFYQIKMFGADNQCISGYTGPGPFKVVNCYLEATGENYINGGARPADKYGPNTGLLIASADLEFRRNHLRKPMAWIDEFTDRYLTCKNLFELKNMSYALIEGNVMENSWAQGQAGEVFLCQRGDEDSGTASKIQHATYRYNKVSNTASVCSLLLIPASNPSVASGQVAFENNLFLDIGNPALAGGSSQFSVPRQGWQLNYGAPNITFNHNTMVMHANAVSGATHVFYVTRSGVDYTNFVATNNIFPLSGNVSDGGIASSEASQYEKNCFDYAMPSSYTVNKNAHSNYYFQTLVPGDFYQGAAWALDGNYRPTSATLQGAATDGTDVGCDITNLNVAISGVAEA